MPLQVMLVVVGIVLALMLTAVVWVLRSSGSRAGQGGRLTEAGGIGLVLVFCVGAVVAQAAQGH